MKVLFQVVTSSIGKKWIMGLTGFALVGFVIIHMLGNLQIFIGQDMLNTYAKFLKASEEVLWAFRAGLFTVAVAHVLAAIGLVLENNGARPVAYRAEKSAASKASRTMIYSGTIVLIFIVFHLLHFTAGKILPEYYAHNLPHDAEGRADVYTMVVKSFSIPWVSAFYILSVGLLTWHMSHGVSSMFQSLGLRNKRSAPVIDTLAIGLSVVIFLGMSAVPAAVLLKLVS